MTGYNKEAQQLNSDGDATRFAPQAGLLQSLFASEFTDSYQELRVATAPEKPLRLLLGGSYFYSKRVDNSLLFPSRTLSNPRRIRDIAAFGSIAWRFLPQVTITAEGRYQEDRIRVLNILLENTFKSFLPKVTLDYKVNQEVLLYALASRGNKPGDFNTAAGTPIENRVVEEERLNNYEIGAKTQWLDRRLTLNATGYRIDWTNQGYQDTVFQRDAAGNLILAGGVPRTVVLTRNIGKTRITGGELDGSFVVVPGWTLRAAYSYTDAQFRDFVSRLPIAYGGVASQVAGNRVFNTPKNKLILSTIVDRPIGDGLRAFGSGDVTFRGRQYTDELNTAYVGNLTLVNARIGLSYRGFEAFLYGRNLTNSKIPDFATRSTDFNTNINSYLFTLRPSRQFGLTAAMKFY